MIDRYSGSSFDAMWIVWVNSSGSYSQPGNRALPMLEKALSNETSGTVIIDVLKRVRPA
jgi:hypothetical protein